MRLKTLILVCIAFTLHGCGGSSVRDTTGNTIKVHSHSEITTKLLQQHEEWRGTPYLLGGNNRRGIDCSSFTQITFLDQFQRQIPRTTADQVMQGVFINRNSLEPGDLVFFRTGGKKVRHVGIYLEDGVFLHASTSRGVMLSRLDNSYWKQHYWTARRIPL